jgi:hypothetical protein
MCATPGTPFEGSWVSRDFRLNPAWSETKSVYPDVTLLQAVTAFAVCRYSLHMPVALAFDFGH